MHHLLQASRQPSYYFIIIAIIFDQWDSIFIGQNGQNGPKLEIKWLLAHFECINKVYFLSQYTTNQHATDVRFLAHNCFPNLFGRVQNDQKGVKFEIKRF